MRAFAIVHSSVGKCKDWLEGQSEGYHVDWLGAVVHLIQNWLRVLPIVLTS